MGKQASLRYKVSRDGFKREVFYEKCLGEKVTIVLVQTDQNSVIGGYCPDQWESTNDMENSEGEYYCKDIVSGKPFLFYFLNDEIQIIKHKDDKIPFMRSDGDFIMSFGGGFEINDEQKRYSSASASNNYWVHP